MNPEQLPLPPFQPGSRTSRQGSRDAAAHAPTQAERVLAFIAKRGARGATRAEIEAGMGLRISSVCGRVKALQEEGKVVVSDLPPRVSAQGSKGEVLVAQEGEE